MYVGHLGIALWARAQKPAVPLWLLCGAALGPDWIETGLIALGIRHVALLSHGLPGALVGLSAFALLGGLLSRSRAGAALSAAVFVSHLCLDFLTGHKPTWPGGPRIGLGLYEHPWLDFAAESAVLVFGWACYRRTLSPARREGVGARLLIASLLVGQAVFDIVAIGKRPPPRGEEAADPPVDRVPAAPTPPVRFNRSPTLVKVVRESTDSPQPKTDNRIRTIE